MVEMLTEVDLAECGEGRKANAGPSAALKYAPLRMTDLVEVQEAE